MDADHHRVRFLRVVLADAENGLAILATDGVGDVPVELDLAAVDFHLCCAADEFRNLDFLAVPLKSWRRSWVAMSWTTAAFMGRGSPDG